MTENEAIKAIQNDLEWHSKELKPAYKEVLKMAIQALEEIQQYRAIGTSEQFEEWLDAVVAELKEKKDEASIEAGKRSVRIGEDEYEDDPYYEGKKHAYVHAIELLRKGGV